MGKWQQSYLNWNWRRLCALTKSLVCFYWLLPLLCPIVHARFSSMNDPPFFLFSFKQWSYPIEFQFYSKCFILLLHYRILQSNRSIKTNDNERHISIRSRVLIRCLNLNTCINNIKDSNNEEYILNLGWLTR